MDENVFSDRQEQPKGVPFWGGDSATVYKSVEQLSVEFTSLINQRSTARDAGHIRYIDNAISQIRSNLDEANQNFLYSGFTTTDGLPLRYIGVDANNNPLANGSYDPELTKLFNDYTNIMKLSDAEPGFTYRRNINGTQVDVALSQQASAIYERYGELALGADGRTPKHPGIVLSELVDRHISKTHTGSVDSQLITENLLNSLENRVGVQNLVEETRVALASNQNPRIAQAIADAKQLDALIPKLDKLGSLMWANGNDEAIGKTERENPAHASPQAYPAPTTSSEAKYAHLIKPDDMPTFALKDYGTGNFGITGELSPEAAGDKRVETFRSV